MPLTAERRQQAEEVLSALNPNYVGANCCILCGRSCSMWAYAAMNPDGDRKGVCPRCAGGHTLHWRDKSSNAALVRIEQGYYD